MTDEVKVCSVPVISESEQGAKEFSLLGVTAFFWENGKTLRVRFLDGDSVVQAKVEKIAHEWSQIANIKFQFGNDPDSEIRISFQRQGSWSQIGMSALQITDRNEPTMNFGWLRSDTPDDEYSRVVLHEFGHALGFTHEHKHPNSGIKWNRQAVLDYYRRTNGWDDATTERNVLQAESRDATQFSSFDRDSIMLYAIPKELTTDGFSVGWSTKFSVTDKQFAQTIYPLITGNVRNVFIKSAHGDFFLDHHIASRSITLADQPFNPATGAFNGELWQIVDPGGGRVFIKSAHGEFFLDHHIASRSIALADQPFNPATGAFNGELWQIVDAGDGKVLIKSAHGNFWLDHHIASRSIKLADQPFNPATGAFDGELWQIVNR